MYQRTCTKSFLGFQELSIPLNKRSTLYVSPKNELHQSMERSQFWLFWCVSSMAWRWQTRLPEATNWNEGVRTSPTALGRWLVNTLGLCGCFFSIHWHHAHVSTIILPRFSLSWFSVAPCVMSPPIWTHSRDPHLPSWLLSLPKWSNYRWRLLTLIDTHTHACVHTHVHTLTRARTHIIDCWMKTTPGHHFFP